MSIRVLVADDDPVILATLATAFGRQPDFVLVGQATDGEEAVTMGRELGPDLIIMDIRMPKLSGIEATKQLRALGVGAPVLLLTADEVSARSYRQIRNVSLLRKGDVGIRETLDAARAAVG